MLSVEIISDFLVSPEAKVEEHAGDRATRRASAGRMTATAAQLAPSRRAGGRSTTAPARNAALPAQQDKIFCFRVGVRQLRPLHDPAAQPAAARPVAVAIGFAVAFALRSSPIASAGWSRLHRGATGVLYTIPSLAFIFLLLPITGLGWTTAIIVLSVYTLQIIYRNIVAGLSNVPSGQQGRRARDGNDRAPVALAGRAAAGPARDHRRAADRDGIDGRDLDPDGLRERQHARRARSTSRSTSRPTS